MWGGGGYFHVSSILLGVEVFNALLHYIRFHVSEVLSCVHFGDYISIPDFTLVFLNDDL